jgi:very-short-patch-repair endonuclease
MYLEFVIAYEYIKDLNIHTRRQWNEYSKTKRPKNIPSCPHKIYKEWISWDHWLSKENYQKKKKQFLEFEDAKTIISKFNIKNKAEWNKFCTNNKPTNIPSTPNIVYKDKWVSWNHWLSSNTTQNKQKKYLLFYDLNECKETIKKFNIKTHKEWQNWVKNQNKDKKIPTNPDKTYKGEWVSWVDFLNTNNKSYSEISENFLSFEKARNCVRSLKLKNQKEWGIYCRNNKPKNIPSCPNRTYKNEWLGYSDWLGTKTVATQLRSYLPYEEAKEYIRNLNFNGSWEDLTKILPPKIPKAPHHVYKENWTDYYDFMGQQTPIKSKGEYEIAKWLERNNIIFIKEKKFDDCKNIRKLPFDFYIPSHNICIEYDGIQHYEAIDFFGGVKALQQNKYKDNLKNNFCENNNIYLIRIKYNDNITLKLNEIFNISLKHL